MTDYSDFFDEIPDSDSVREGSPKSEVLDQRGGGAAGEEKIDGEILRVIYSNADGTYCVVKMKSSEGKGVTLVGALSGVTDGMNIEATGHWEVHKEHGPQFRVSGFCSLLPTSREGIINYLGSGILPGIGEAMAERIVRHFGESTLEILDTAPERLQEVNGIGRKKVEEISEHWKENNAGRQCMIFLQGLGISPAYAMKIANKYTPTLAPEVVRRNPYRLALEVEGIGFLTADRIARNLGIACNHPKRLCAGIVHTLEFLATQGNVCYPDAMLVEKAAEVLNVSPDDARMGLQIAIEEGKVQADLFPEVDKIHRMVYSRLMRRSEVKVATYLNALIQSRFPNAEIPPLKSGDNAVKLNTAQNQGFENAFRHSISVITGGPGVGKTTVISQIVYGAHRLGMKLALAAPTGRAAKRMSEATGHTAATIHRLLKWEPENAGFYYNEDKQLPFDMLVVDEISMLDIHLACALFGAIAPGTRVVLVGDKDQLPSVGPGNVLHDLIACGLVPVTYLTEIYRQAAGSRIITNAHKVNGGTLPDITPPLPNSSTDFYWIEQNDPEKVADILQKMYLDRVPNAFGYNSLADIQILAPMRRGACGVIALNEAIQAVINPPNPSEKPQFQMGNRLFRKGDKVMQISNNYDKNVFNGEMGRIISIDTANAKFEVLFDHNKVEYLYNECDQLELAYAITVHKSQGSEFPVVLMPLVTQHYVMLQRNLLYTGMTRAKKLLVIVGGTKALQTAIANNTPSQRISMLVPRLVQASRIE